MGLPVRRDDPIDPEERAAQAAQLRHAHELSRDFYAEAAHIGIHAIIEHTGLINEHLKMLERAAEAGHDITMANKHSSTKMPPMQHYEAAYLAEKFMCMMGPFFDDAAWSAFVAACEEERRE